jgi:hypothetical protein
MTRIHHDQITLASFLSLSISCATSATDAGAALGRLGDRDGAQARRDIDAEVGRLEDFQRLLLGLHDVGQRRITRLVQAQVGGDDGR